jgi:hypothetical protein
MLATMAVVFFHFSTHDTLPRRDIAAVKFHTSM